MYFNFNNNRKLKLFFLVRLLLVFCLFLLLIFYISSNTHLNVELELKPCYDCSRISSKYSSTCGSRADNRGQGQWVLSYSFYKGKVESDTDSYLQGIEANLQTLRKVYNSKTRTILRSSSWVIRIYSDEEMPSNLTNKYPNELFWCDVREILPDGYLKTFKMSWRFLPLGDPTVDIFLSRDLDGILTEREYFAVDEWLKLSNYSFHSMRDHPWHGTHLLGGMWGANNDILGLETARRIRQNILEAGPMNDQVALSQFIWTDFSHQVLAHDSFHCLKVDKYGHNSRPWPTQREPSGDFVGNPVRRFKKNKIRTECPVECRPPSHKDWNYC